MGCLVWLVEEIPLAALALPEVTQPCIATSSQVSAPLLLPGSPWFSQLPKTTLPAFVSTANKSHPTFQVSAGIQTLVSEAYELPANLPLPLPAWYFFPFTFLSPTPLPKWFQTACGQ